ncbi:hypothetical protein [Reichenbachiella ulvae]|uniref:Uncharacterized protein n=1 Tax=Reichenbachiella ulvae TaxID=2980104 RepID=A0ABT3CNI6_9BACT|nr:hypothetical protein [Reichenbachiella ulvae]MCV9385099.1 hypothetical protein [Reichenbachiella ulvae]
MNETIKSESLSYYGLIVFGLLFGMTFFIGGLINWLDPNGTVNINGVIEQSSIINTAPIIILGLGAIVAVTYYRSNLGLAELSNTSIKINFLRKKFQVDLSSIKSAEIVSFINGYAIKLHLSDGSSLKIQTDQAGFKFSDFSNLKRSYYRTRMWEYLKENNVKLIEEYSI